MMSLKLYLNQINKNSAPKWNNAEEVIHRQEYIVMATSIKTRNTSNWWFSLGIIRRFPSWIDHYPSWNASCHGKSSILKTWVFQDECISDAHEVIKQIQVQMNQTFQEMIGQIINIICPVVYLENSKINVLRVLRVCDFQIWCFIHSKH